MEQILAPSWSYELICEWDRGFAPARCEIQISKPSVFKITPARSMLTDRLHKCSGGRPAVDRYSEYCT
jgi:hypothetical protein